MRTSSRARCTSSPRSIIFSTFSSTRRNPVFTPVLGSSSVKSNPPAAVRLAYPALRPVSLQPSLDGVQELERGAAVEDAVVEGDLHVHHAAYGDGVVYHDGTFDDGFRGEDRCLRVVDNRSGDHASQRARVVHGERAARDVFGA